jgi:hypothetical protein
MTDQDFKHVLDWIYEEICRGVTPPGSTFIMTPLCELLDLELPEGTYKNFDVTGLRLFCDLDLDEMPLFVNDPTWRCEVAKWRLEHAK